MSDEPITIGFPTGIKDQNGRIICVGDRIRIDLSNGPTREEYWKPEYIVYWEAPSFRLKHIGGSSDSDTARWYFNVPQPSSTACIETVSIGVPSPAVPDDVASLSAAREAAAVERAFRDGLAYATNVRVKDHDQAWQQSLARERLGDTAALDRLIAERVREAVEAEREACARMVKKHPMRFAGQTEDVIRDGLSAAIRARDKEGQS